MAKQLKFTKMHGIGNDYVYVNCFEEKVENPSELAKFVSNRNFGAGSDGLILIKPSDVADFEMDMYNEDGSRGKMCGNGIRCVAKYVYDKGLTDKEHISVATQSGIKYLDFTVENGKAVLIKVNMGAPEFDTDKIPVVSDEKKMVGAPFEVNGKNYTVSCVSMGNPHCVIFTNEDVKKMDLEKIGPSFEKHERFPEGVNTEFVNIINRKELMMRVWERGSGETLACGTGACATAVCAIANGYADDEVTVHLLGGDLKIFWDKNKDLVYMTGPATIVYDGVFYFE
ncbi:MAG: diaminopimelate epimerase [Lachnospiraceae bacterium]|nr:diaminopimelate epimerase [Lachnospiraceae bacterium]